MKSRTNLEATAVDVAPPDLAQRRGATGDARGNDSAERDTERLDRQRRGPRVAGRRHTVGGDPFGRLEVRQGVPGTKAIARDAAGPPRARTPRPGDR